MYWIPLMTGVVNAVFILDLIITLGTGDGLASLIADASGNSVANAVLANIPTDPIIFWTVSGVILVSVLALECLLIYLAFLPYTERSGSQ